MKRLYTYRRSQLYPHVWVVFNTVTNEVLAQCDSRAQARAHANQLNAGVTTKEVAA